MCLICDTLRQVSGIAIQGDAVGVANKYEHLQHSKSNHTVHDKDRREREPGEMMGGKLLMIIVKQ